MKKSLVFATALAGMLALAPAALVSAADNTASTHGDITFETDDQTTTPIVTPPDPGNPTKPDGGGNGTPGALRIDFAPDLHFGIQKITSTNQDYKPVQQAGTATDASGTRSYMPNFVQVTDNRGLDATDPTAGWTLSLKQEAQFANGANLLDGAALSFTNNKFITRDATGAAVASPTGYTSPANVTLTPGTAATLATADNTTAGTVQEIWNTTNTLTPITADNDLKDTTGAEKTDDAFKTAFTAAPKDDGINLNVPGATHKVKGAYNTDLTWTLSATVANTTPAAGTTTPDTTGTGTTTP